MQRAPPRPEVRHRVSSIEALYLELYCMKHTLNSENTSFVREARAIFFIIERSLQFEGKCESNSSLRDIVRKRSSRIVILRRSLMWDQLCNTTVDEQRMRENGIFKKSTSPGQSDPNSSNWTRLTLEGFIRESIGAKASSWLRGLPNKAKIRNICITTDVASKNGTCFLRNNNDDVAYMMEVQFARREPVSGADYQAYVRMRRVKWGNRVEDRMWGAYGLQLLPFMYIVRSKHWKKADFPVKMTFAKQLQRWVDPYTSDGRRSTHGPVWIHSVRSFQQITACFFTWIKEAFAFITHRSNRLKLTNDRFGFFTKNFYRWSGSISKIRKECTDLYE